MGCHFSHLKEQQEEKQNPHEVISTQRQVIKSIEHVVFEASDLVNEQAGQISKDYTLMNPPLGKGSYGEVRKAIHKTTQMIRAVKIINKAQCPQSEQQKIQHEVEILRKLDHPNIIKVFEFYQDPKFFYIVTDLCTGGELFDKIQQQQSFSEKTAANYMKSILSAVNSCHKQNIMHRDLKPENLLFETSKEDSQIKLIDFGSSIQFIPSQKQQLKIGTPYYIAPEVIQRKYDEKCDIWSSGVILYIMLCGYPPFNGANDKVIMDKIQIGKFQMKSKDWDQISQLAKDFIKKMLERDVKKRFSAEEALMDPWVQQYSEKTNVSLPILQNSLDNMKNFRSGKKLSEAVWMFVVNYLSTKDERQELLKIFQSLDLNGDGKLSREELIVGYTKIMKDENQATEVVDKIMKAIDKNDNGEIDYSEWIMATMNKQNMLSKQKLEAAFKMFDKDGSGNVDIGEFKQMFGGMNLSERVWKQLIQEVDTDNNGTISFDEFKTMLMNQVGLDQNQSLQSQQLNQQSN